MRYLLTLVLLAISTSCYGWGSNNPSSFVTANSIAAPATCGTSTVLDTDTFSGTLAGFLDNTNWTIGSGEVAVTINTLARMTRSSTTAAAECQWREIVVGTNFTDNYLGVQLRASAATGLRYVGTVKNNAPSVGQSTLLFFVYDGTTLVEQIGELIVIPSAMVAGDKLAWQVYDIGDNTTFNFWLNGVGSKPSDYGAADYTMIDNPINPVNTGSYSGMFIRDWTSLSSSITSTSGGSVE